MIEIGEKKLTPQQRYDKANTKNYAIKVIKTTEPDIFQKLERVKNKSGYIKELIRRDISNDSDEVEDGPTTAELLVKETQECRTRQILYLIHDCKTLEEAQEIIRGLLPKD